MSTLSSAEIALFSQATDVYNACVAEVTNSNFSSSSSSSSSSQEEAILICLTQSLFTKNAKVRENALHNNQYIYTMALVWAAALTFFMQAGFAMVCTGAVRKKNLQNTMLKSLLDACGAAVAFYAIGYAFALGDNPNNPNAFIGTTHFFSLSAGEDAAFWLFQYGFSAAAATIVAGTLAERCKMSAYFLYAIFLSGFVYPIIVHAVWSPYGFLSSTNYDKLLFGVGVIDVAGGGVVHMTGGATALIATLVLGPRRGRFHDEITGELLDRPKILKGHSVALQLLGVMILWFGWYGFNSGSALVMGGEENGDFLATTAHANTTISGAAAGITIVIFNFIYSKHKIKKRQRRKQQELEQKRQKVEKQLEEAEQQQQLQEEGLEEHKQQQQNQTYVENIQQEQENTNINDNDNNNNNNIEQNNINGNHQNNNNHHNTDNNSGIFSGGRKSSQRSNLSARRRHSSYDLVSTMNGVLGGLVAITASCGVVETWASLIIGCIGALLYMWSSKILVKYRIDDAVDAIPVHLVCGMWAMIAPGLFATPDKLRFSHGNREVQHAGLFYPLDNNGLDFTLLLAQLVGIIMIIVWTTLCMYPFFMILQHIGHFRAGALEEVEGLDNKYFENIQNDGTEQIDVEEVATKICKTIEHEIEKERSRSSASGTRGARSYLSGSHLSGSHYTGGSSGNGPRSHGSGSRSNMSTSNSNSKGGSGSKAGSSMHDDSQSRGDNTQSSSGSKGKSGADVDIRQEMEEKLLHEQQQLDEELYAIDEFEDEASWVERRRLLDDHCDDNIQNYDDNNSYSNNSINNNNNNDDDDNTDQVSSISFDRSDRKVQFM